MTKFPKGPITDKPDNLHLVSSSDKPAATPIKSKAAKLAPLPPVTFSPEALNNLLNKLNEQAAELAALKAAFKGDKAVDIAKAKVDQAVKAVAAKSEKSTANEKATIKAFAKIGIKGVIPKVNVLTFNLWLARGFRPLEGSKSVKIANLRLFHESQVRALTMAELKSAAAQIAAAEARRNGNPAHEVQ